MQALAEPRNSTDPDIPKVQRQQVRTLAQWMASCKSREKALYQAGTPEAISMTAIAKEPGLSVSRVSRLIARAEGAKGKTLPRDPHDPPKMRQHPRSSFRPYQRFT